MPGFEPFRDMTEAERKVWQEVSRTNSREAGRANLDQARQMVADHNRAAVDRANEGGRD